MITFTEEQLNTKITIQDARSLGFCAAGCRRHFENHEKALGMTFRQVIDNGVTVRQVLALNDPFFNRLAEKVVAK